MLAGLCLLSLKNAIAQNTGNASPIIVDATATVGPPAPANYTFDPADAKSPDGHVLGINSVYLTRDGKPWLPVMGEMHFSRVPEAEWEDQILKMKSSGVEIIAAYIIWIHHEEIEDQWDWSGNKDLRKFVQLCAKHGMYVVPRVGPWSHAEVRNGGFPDWLLKKTPPNGTLQTRSNEPTYIGYVDTYFKQIAAQLKGLMWRDGGPVVAIQLENEYRGGGPLRGSNHILKLKEMAEADGMRVPFFTVTGWDGASIPHGEVLPVYGGYPDAPWDASIKPLAPGEVYAFRFGSRVTGDMGAQNGALPTGNAANFTTDTPFMTAEMGGGMQITYHRRPVVSADDIAAMAPVMLGSGVNLYGSYMFQGGENPDGKLTTLQESLATHAPNDLPVKTYDFEAPLGEFGDERPSLLKMKSWNYFLNDFGAELAPMTVRKPDVTPAGARDLAVPRISVRSAGAGGFLFVNNHVRAYPMPARENFQVEVKLPEGRTLRIPEKPIILPADAYFVWPFNEDLAGLKLRFATAQPLAKLGTDAEPVFAFFAQPGIKPVLAVENTPGLKYTLSPSSTSGVETHDGTVWFTGLHPEHTHGDTVRFTLADGRHVTLLLVSQQGAEQAWRVHSGKITALVSTPQQAFVDGPLITLENIGTNAFAANIIPDNALLLTSADPKTKLAHGGSDITASISSITPATVAVTPKQTKQAGEVAPLPAGFKPSGRPRTVAAAPTGDNWSRAAAWTLPLPKPAPSANTQQFLRIHYTGDVAHLSVGGKLLDDNFSDGRPWLVGLSRFTPQLATGPLELSIYPLRKDPPIFFEPGLEPKIEGAQAADLQSVELLTEYRLRLRAEAK